MRRDCPESGVVCFGCGQRGHVRRECPVARHGGSSRARSNIQCYNCGRFGHMARDCFNSESDPDEFLRYYYSDEDDFDHDDDDDSEDEYWR